MEEGRQLRLDQSQYELLVRCAEEGDFSPWNQWRLEEGAQIMLDGAELSNMNLEGANLSYAHLREANIMDAELQGVDLTFARLEEAQFSYSHLEKARMMDAHLERADLTSTHLEGANLSYTNLEGAQLLDAKVDSSTDLTYCRVNRDTDLTNVNVRAAHVNDGLLPTLEYLIRRRNWQEWYSNQSAWSSFPVKMFWWLSDYGRSTARILWCFLLSVMLFAGVFYLADSVLGLHLVAHLDSQAGVAVPGPLRPLRAMYFSVVTMTTLGFGDLYAAPDSYAGHILLSIQVVLGYVLLGALITRLSILFNAPAPASLLSDEVTRRSRIVRCVNRLRR
jgi:hypothetical protein